MEKGHVQAGQVGFPLLLNKALKCVKGAWIWGLYKLDFVEYGEGACIWGLSSWTLCKKGMFRVGK